MWKVRNVLQARARAAVSGNAPTIKRNQGGPGAHDIHMENFDVSNGGAELIEARPWLAPLPVSTLATVPSPAGSSADLLMSPGQGLLPPQDQDGSLLLVGWAFPWLVDSEGPEEGLAIVCSGSGGLITMHAMHLRLLTCTCKLSASTSLLWPPVQVPACISRPAGRLEAWLS